LLLFHFTDIDVHKVMHIMQIMHSNITSWAYRVVASFSARGWVSRYKHRIRWRWVTRKLL